MCLFVSTGMMGRVDIVGYLIILQALLGSISYKGLAGLGMPGWCILHKYVSRPLSLCHVE